MPLQQQRQQAENSNYLLSRTVHSVTYIRGDIVAAAEDPPLPPALEAFVHAEVGCCWFAAAALLLFFARAEEAAQPRQSELSVGCCGSSLCVGSSAGLESCLGFTV